ncbi:hypothetical protein QBC41DRAFT_381236 [Cercophora samala]|uniref:Uncharacterized protein n=1 Tax=Cercophora samala TaxID=330535 RepID=A0AA40DDD6_9PEZI|nr:hypothetical protein QBC41DRAFT_381236 [Cercophora samala]
MEALPSPLEISCYNENQIYDLGNADWDFPLWKASKEPSMAQVASPLSECDCSSICAEVKTNVVPIVHDGMANLPTLAESLPPDLSGHPRGPGAADPQASTQHVRRFVCAECVFAKKTGSCDGAPEASCSRCKRLSEKARKINPSTGIQEHLSMPLVMFFDIKATHELLVSLRVEIDKVTFQEGFMSLESWFSTNDHILCHIDSGGENKVYSPYSTTSHTIAMTHLSTTSRARLDADASDSYVEPSLPATLLDIFADGIAPAWEMKALSDLDRRVIVASSRCAFYLGLLFNWNTHLIQYERFSRLKGIGPIMGKNLILELMYALAHRVEDLAFRLLYLINETLHPEDTNSQKTYDPAIVLCALRIVYTSVEKFRKSTKDWDHGSLKGLKIFIDTLRSRVPTAIRVIQRYRHQKLGFLCQESVSTAALVQLIEDCTVKKSIATFVFERFRPDGLWPIGGPDTGRKDAEDPNRWARSPTIVNLELDLELDRLRSVEKNSTFVSRLDLDLPDFDTALSDEMTAEAFGSPTAESRTTGGSRVRKRKLSAFGPAQDTAAATEEGPQPKRWFEGVESVVRTVVDAFGFMV